MADSTAPSGYYRLPPLLRLPQRPMAEAETLKFCQDLHAMLQNQWIPQVDRLENLLLMGEAADMPPAESSRRLYYQTDTGELYYDDNTTSWTQVGGPGLAPGSHTHTIEVKNNTGSAMSAGDICRVSGDDSGTPTVQLADASDVSTAKGMMLCLAENVSASGGTGTAVIIGTVTGLSSLTAGAVQYLSKTAGEMVEDISGYTTAGDIVRVLGHALSATSMFFRPDQTWVEIV